MPKASRRKPPASSAQSIQRTATESYKEDPDKSLEMCRVWGTLYYNQNKEPATSIGSYLGPIQCSFALNMERSCTRIIMLARERAKRLDFLNMRHSEHSVVEEITLCQHLL